MSQHPALERHPRYIEQMAVVAEVQGRSDAIWEQIRAHQAQVDQYGRDQEAAIAEAVAAGTPIPEAPPAPPPIDNLGQALFLIREERKHADADVEQLVAEIAGEVEQHLASAVAEEMRAVRKHADAVEAARLRVETALRTAARVRRAVENGQAEVTRPSPADRTRPAVPTADLLDMARAGADPLEPLPIGHRESRILGVTDQDHADASLREHQRALVESLPADTQAALRRRTVDAGRF